MPTRLELRGATSMSRRMRTIAKSYEQTRIDAALEAEMSIELKEARRRTPKDTHALEMSGKLDREGTRGTLHAMGISFGGQVGPVDVYYAVQVHEDLEAFHRVGEAKFLENTLMESLPHLAARVGKRLMLSGS